MLIIRAEQLAVLGRELDARFDDDAHQHVNTYFPDRCRTLGAEATGVAVREGLMRARRYGIRSRYDLLRYLNLLFEFGPPFEQTEENAWARKFLEDTSRSGTIRMDLLMDAAWTRIDPASAATDAEIIDEPATEFDGLVWDDAGVDSNYVPTSVEPDRVPIVRAPHPRDAFVEVVAPLDHEPANAHDFGTMAASAAVAETNPLSAVRADAERR